MWYPRLSVWLKQKSSLKTNLNLSKDDFVIIYIGRYVYYKGFDIVVKTFNKLIEKYDHIKLITLGKKDELHETGLTKFEEEQIKSNPKIIDFGFTNNVREFLALSDLLFFPSQKEGMPVNMIEATAMGVPIVTYKSRGCEEIVEDHKNGRILNTLDIDDYFKALDEIINNKDLIKKFQKAQVEIIPSLSRKIYIEKQIKDYNDSL